MRRRLAALISVLAVLLALGAPAHAATDRFKWMSCAAGTATTGHIDDGAMNYDGSLMLHGRFQTCHPPTQYEVFALAVYLSNGHTYGTATTYWGGAPLPPLFEAKVGAPDETQAVCLLAAPNVRLDCRSVTVTVTPGDGRMKEVGAQIPVDSPLVDRPAAISIEYGMVDQGPNCPTCWG
ncbi:hypothetical protein QEZ54_09380 [Catellatospora sp. KI3]|uniref:hypothetical protein n=1 Tax=Catellatospora sp. KI3 TaxID=3041620 RepID=UPI002482E7A5|nr:hypothetical protein [Catellatospora sp. KI3]MDI1461176.1 hypothetical protein [Catellatospora sp. KI3]